MATPMALRSACFVHGAHVHAVDRDAAAGHVIEAGYKMGQRGFAGPRGPEQRDGLARLDLEAHIAQHVLVAVAVIAKGDAVEDDAAGGWNERVRAYETG